MRSNLCILVLLIFALLNACYAHFLTNMRSRVLGGRIDRGVASSDPHDEIERSLIGRGRLKRVRKFNSNSLGKLVKLSGGASRKSNQETEDNIENEDDDFYGDNDEFSADLHQGTGGSHVLSFVTDMWRKTPPVTQVYIGSSIAVTLAAWAMNNNKWPELLHLKWTKVLLGQVWRPVSAFLFFGQFGLNYILTIQFVWTYMTQLEKLSYKRPEEFLFMLIFGSGALLGSYALLGLSPSYLGHNLSTYLVYIWARVFEGTDVNVMDLFVLRAEMLPCSSVHRRG